MATPSLFYADYYGATYKDKGRDGNEYESVLTSHRWQVQATCQSFEDLTEHISDLSRRIKLAGQNSVAMSDLSRSGSPTNNQGGAFVGPI